MTKKEVLSDITALVDRSDSIDHANSLIDDYMHAVTTLSSLAKFVAPKKRMTTSGDGDDAGSGDDFEFGGGSFGGGGGSGSW